MDTVGRNERPLSPGAGLLARFAAELRKLRSEAGGPSYRELATRTHFSRSALAAAASGRALPSLPVLTAFVTGCGADPEVWRKRWETVRDGLQTVALPVWYADSPFPTEPVADGACPDAAGCGPDAVTAHARRVALTGTRTIVGHVQLRYSPGTGAAWSRFEGYHSLDHLATKHFVEVSVETCRESDGIVVAFRDEYRFDHHWSDLLRTGTGPLYARARIYLDGIQSALTETGHLSLP